MNEAHKAKIQKRKIERAAEQYRLACETVRNHYRIHGRNNPDDTQAIALRRARNELGTYLSSLTGNCDLANSIMFPTIEL